MSKKNKVTLAELQERQSWSLEQKIDHSLLVIETFLSRTNNNAYVSFSGGKDSTVLLQLCRLIKPDIKAVFSNTGVEYPDILKFVKKQENVTIVRPEKSFKQCIEEYGFPLVGKEQARNVWYTKNKPDSKIAWRSLHSDVAVQRISKRYLYLLDKDYDICNMCCKFLKKKPLSNYTKQSGLYPIQGLLADESRMRKTEYLRHGCNIFDSDMPKSNPLSIWKESDIVSFIEINNIKLADIYYKGANRTGCCGCAFGAHLEKQEDCRYATLYRLYPKFYKWFMDCENNGVTYREAIRELFSKFDRYLPDEEPKNLFNTEW